MINGMILMVDNHTVKVPQLYADKIDELIVIARLHDLNFGYRYWLKDKLIQDGTYDMLYFNIHDPAKMTRDFYFDKLNNFTIGIGFKDENIDFTMLYVDGEILTNSSKNGLLYPFIRLKEIFANNKIGSI